jgi:hypothetical protein
MAHNFKISTGTRYASKMGNDANPGTQLLPKKTPAGMQAGANGGTFVFGTGNWNNENVGSVANSNQQIWLADGVVVFSGTGTFFNAPGFRGNIFIGFAFENFLESFIGNGNQLRQCFFRNTALNIWQGTYGADSFRDNVLINTNYKRSTQTANPTYINRCLWMKNSIADLRIGSGNFLVTKTYFSPETLLITDRPALFTDCNIRCNSLTVNGVEYPNLAAAKAVDPTWFPGCINANPQFVDETTENFTLKPNSPHLPLGIGPNYLRLGSGFYLKGSASAVTADSHYIENAATLEQFPIYYADNITASVESGRLRLKVIESVSGSFIGVYRVKIKISETAQQLSRLNLVAGLNFDTDFPSAENLFDSNNPETLNNNVPNRFNYTSGAAGRNPNRLDYLMRWSTKDNPDINVPSDWITGANKLIFEWNTIPQYNPVSQIGNGDPTYLPGAAGEDAPMSIIAKWIDLEIQIMNNYYSK